jgi:hypothetical protein
MSNDDHPRFVTDTIRVTGETPAGLEQAALAYAARMTGCAEDQLAAQTPYKIYFTAEIAGKPVEQLYENQRQARASGDPLYASITVAGWAGHAPSGLREGEL